jgi:hypothetical protein
VLLAALLPLAKHAETYIKEFWVPCAEEPGKVGRFEPLLDDDDGDVGAAPGRVGQEVVLEEKYYNKMMFLGLNRIYY